MKKFLKLTIALVMMLVTLLIPSDVYADGNPVADLSINIKSQSEIVATISIPANYDLGGFNAKLNYDKDTLTCSKVDFISQSELKNEDPNDPDATALVQKNHKVNEGRIIITCASAYPIVKKDSYTLITAYFSLNEGKVFNENSIYFTEWKIGNSEGKLISSNTINQATYHLNCSHALTSSKVAKEPTCDVDGVEESSCSLCGEVFESKPIPALGHDYGEWKVTKEPTCTEKGEKTSYCSRCDETITEEIDMIAHDFGEWEIIKEATCIEEGTQERICSVCGNTETQSIPALGHDFGEWKVTKEPTEKEEGSKERVCKVCGEKEVASIEKIKVTTPSQPTDKNDKTNTSINKNDKVKTGDTSNTKSYVLYAITSAVVLAIIYCLEKRRKILNK